MTASLSCTKQRRRQLGAATLLLTMGLLLSMSILLLYLNRSVMFEQKTSANQLRSMLALEMAEAGLEWATGMLNTPQHIDDSCAFAGSTAGVSFRRQYVQTHWGDGTATATEMAPAAASYPGCKIDGNNRICSCPGIPSSGAASVSPGSVPLPGFAVSFFATSDPEAVRVVATGCTARLGACTLAGNGASDASITVLATLKLRRLPRTVPAAPLTCGGSCMLGASHHIVNQALGSTGVLVNAGGSISLAHGSSAVSVPGQPSANALLGDDPALRALSNQDPDCSQSALFGAFFGATLSQYARSPMTRTIADCGSADVCSVLVDTAYAQGWRSFYFPGGFARNAHSANLGSENDPVTLVSMAGFNLNGNQTVYGLLVSNDATLHDFGTRSANLRGAVLSCAGYSDNGDGTLTYDAAVLQALQRSTGILVRVPGSWTDRCHATGDEPPAIRCN